ncbi:hypothetical protein KBY70_13940 [Cyanobium sp. ATX 6E8]|uniref:hypothetical protein n=1 Tax=Cyanobium sp. ATX 6E8 TaxID=2823701 RepID=UPI0020CD1FF0|nr:hypothetical protein [Cyanobium sp. ATX 6E8]MCP9943486.1 hypothetical protein [Cyanobium sp. ATX 6E8]
MFYGSNKHPESSLTWIGLIDGLYGINITLMLVGAPGYLGELIRANAAGDINDSSSLKLACEYLFFLVIIALVSFDLWGLHSLSARSDYILRKRASILNLTSLACNAVTTLSFQIAMIRKVDLAQDSKLFIGTQLIDFLALMSLATAYTSHVFLLRTARHAHSKANGSELSAIKVHDASVHTFKSAAILLIACTCSIINFKAGFIALGCGIAYIYIINEYINPKKRERRDG